MNGLNAHIDLCPCAVCVQDAARLAEQRAVWQQQEQFWFVDRMSYNEKVGIYSLTGFDELRYDLPQSFGLFILAVKERATREMRETARIEIERNLAQAVGLGKTGTP